MHQKKTLKKLCEGFNDGIFHEGDYQKIFEVNSTAVSKGKLDMKEAYAARNVSHKMNNSVRDEAVVDKKIPKTHKKNSIKVLQTHHFVN